MKKIHVAFLWHFHQPCYMDVSNGKFVMPWVRFHAVKAYYDMAKVLERFPNIRMTFNFVPSLVKQLEQYQHGAKDIAMEISMKDAGDLTEDERAYLIDNFFSANWDNMIRPFPRYGEL